MQFSFILGFIFIRPIPIDEYCSYPQPLSYAQVIFMKKWVWIKGNKSEIILSPDKSI